MPRDVISGIHRRRNPDLRSERSSILNEYRELSINNISYTVNFNIRPHGLKITMIGIRGKVQQPGSGYSSGLEDSRRSLEEL